MDVRDGLIATEVLGALPAQLRVRRRRWSLCRRAGCLVLGRRALGNRIEFLDGFAACR